MAVLVIIDDSTITVDVLGMVMSGFSLMQISGLVTRQHKILRPLDGLQEKEFLLKNHDTSKMMRNDRTELLEQFCRILDKLESEGYIRIK